MVAISLLQPEHDEWYGTPVEGPLTESRPRHTAPRPARSPSRALPDRATRWRRRRLAALVAGTLLAVGVVGLVQVVAPALGSSSGPAPAASSGSGSSGASPPVAGEVYVVQPGDTLWTVAAAVAPDRDPRPVVDRLRDANDIGGGAPLDVGDRLVIDLG
jgi:LysM domain-containing protein